MREKTIKKIMLNKVREQCGVSLLKKLLKSNKYDFKVYPSSILIPYPPSFIPVPHPLPSEPIPIPIPIPVNILIPVIEFANTLVSGEKWESQFLRFWKKCIIVLNLYFCTYPTSWS